jgi:uncharacterized OsmC-like protein
MSAALVVNEFSISIEQVKDFEFRVKFDKEQLGELIMDEPPPLGKDRGPSPARVLAAAVGNCLTASLLFCARKARVPMDGLRTTVKTQIVRNEAGRMRIGSMEVEINPNLPASETENALRCVGLFEDFCIVTQSVRQGFPIGVKVKGFEAQEAEM